MRSCGVARVLACALSDGVCRRSGQDGAAEDPWAVRQRVSGLDLAGLGSQPECLGCDVQEPRGIAEVEPRFDPVIGRLEDGDAVMRTQCCDTFTGPAIAIPGFDTIPVQDASDEIIIGDQRQLAYSGNHIVRRAGALSAASSGQAYLAVNAANPMYEEDDLSSFGIDISDDFLDNGSDDALLQPNIGRWGGPNGLEIGGQRREGCRIDGSRDRGCIVGGDFAFQLGDASQGLVPADLQFTGHQPIGRVGSVVLAKGPIGGVARRREIALKRIPDLIPLSTGLLLCGDRGGNGTRSHNRQQGVLNGVVNPQSAEGNAARLAIVHPAAGAAVARNVVLCPRVAERQFTSASATPK